MGRENAGKKDGEIELQKIAKGSPSTVPAVPSSRMRTMKWVVMKRLVAPTDFMIAMV